MAEMGPDPGGHEGDGAVQERTQPRGEGNPDNVTQHPGGCEDVKGPRRPRGGRRPHLPAVAEVLHLLLQLRQRFDRLGLAQRQRLQLLLQPHHVVLIRQEAVPLQGTGLSVGTGDPQGWRTPPMDGGSPGTEDPPPWTGDPQGRRTPPMDGESPGTEGRTPPHGRGIPRDGGPPPMGGGSPGMEDPPHGRGTPRKEDPPHGQGIPRDRRCCPTGTPGGRLRCGVII